MSWLHRNKGKILQIFKFQKKREFIFQSSQFSISFVNISVHWTPDNVTKFLNFKQKKNSHFNRHNFHLLLSRFRSIGLRIMLTNFTFVSSSNASINLYSRICFKSLMFASVFTNPSIENSTSSALNILTATVDDWKCLRSRYVNKF